MQFSTLLAHLQYWNRQLALVANHLAGTLPLSLGNLTALTYALGDWTVALTHSFRAIGVGAACLMLVCAPRFSMLYCRRLEIYNNYQPGYMLGGTIPTTIKTLTSLQYVQPTMLVLAVAPQIGVRLPWPSTALVCPVSNHLTVGI